MMPPWWLGNIAAALLHFVLEGGSVIRPKLTAVNSTTYLCNNGKQKTIVMEPELLPSAVRKLPRS